MKINQLNGQLAKVCKSSITVKDENGKTKGVITKCYELSARDSSMIWSKVRKAVGLDATKCIHKMRMVDGEIVYLENINTKDENADLLRDAGFTVARYKRLA